ncbi:hypothetical protein EIM50_22460 [Pseudoxanthomonas sp. SGD-10]|nr:hypothetical protein EIM50_22460 [Pseudoxanthomonas sp. SGD-10]
MKTALSNASIELINKFDRELLDILKEDVKKFKSKHQDNLINFATRRFDLELQAVLKEELARYRKANLKLNVG